MHTRTQQCAALMRKHSITRVCNSHLLILPAEKDFICLMPILPPDTRTVLAAFRQDCSLSPHAHFHQFNFYLFGKDLKKATSSRKPSLFLPVRGTQPFS